MNMKRLLCTVLSSLFLALSCTTAFADNYYENGIFNSINTTKHDQFIALYKDGQMVSSAIGDTIDTSGVEFDKLRIFLWEKGSMKPVRKSVELSYNEVINTPARAGDIPNVYLTGDMTGISHDNKVTLKLKYKSKTESFDSYVTAKWQGNYALYFEKKNFSIKLFKDEALSKKHKVAFKDWDKANNFVLKANWIDSTAARNIVSARLYSTLPNVTLPGGTPGVIDGFPVRLYINNKFFGLYTWNKPKKGWVFGLDDKNPNHLMYFANYALGSGLFERKYSTDHYWELVYPDEHESDEEFDRVTEFVATSTNKEFREHVREYLDLNSLLNFYVFSQLILHADGTGKNINMATYDGKIWYIRPYDLDATYGLFWAGTKTIPYDTDMADENMRKSVLWRKLEDNFPQEIYDRYTEVRHNQMSEDAVLAAFTVFMDEVGEELYAENSARWSQPGKSYMLNQIRDFLNTRYPYLDNYMKKFNINNK